jgi:hypothetical protein
MPADATLTPLTGPAQPTVVCFRPRLSCVESFCRKRKRTRLRLMPAPRNNEGVPTRIAACEKTRFRRFLDWDRSAMGMGRSRVALIYCGMFFLHSSQSRQDSLTSIRGSKGLATASSAQATSSWRSCFASGRGYLDFERLEMNSDACELAREQAMADASQWMEKPPRQPDLALLMIQCAGSKRRTTCPTKEKAVERRVLPPGGLVRCGAYCSGVYRRV